MKRDSQNSNNMHKIIFLHHSTGQLIENAGNITNRFIRTVFPQKTFVSQWMSEYNNVNGTNYAFVDQFFPKSSPYGWNNYPYDYYNIWVKNAGEHKYMGEPTLEMLTKQYELIIFKHCYPVANIDEDINKPDINSSEKRIENYKLQYLALKQKLHEFPDNKFLIWTGSAQVKSNTSQEQAIRARTFFDWVKNEWNINDDNIYLWDFYALETEGELFMKNEYAINIKDSHPGKFFANKAAPIFCQKIIDVMQYNKR